METATSITGFHLRDEHVATAMYGDLLQEIKVYPFALHLRFQHFKDSPLHIFPQNLEENSQVQALRLHHIQEDSQEIIRQGHWRIGLNRKNGQTKVQWKGQELLAEMEGYGKAYDGFQCVWNIAQQASDHIIGMGEKTGPIDRKGKSFQHWNTDAFAYGVDQDPLYASIPFFIMVRESACLGILLDNPAKNQVDFGASNPHFYSMSSEAGGVSAWLFAGDSPQEVLKHYHALTGQAPLPPIWSLGLHQSRYSYFPDSQCRDIVRQYRNRGIPLDALHLDIHYMEGFKSFTFDPKRFPEPRELVHSLREEGVETVVIIDPGIKAEQGYSPFEDLDAQEVLHYPDGKPYEASVWPGNCVFPDFLQASTRAKYRKWLKFYTDLGIKGFWNDMNEPALWGQTVPDVVQATFRGKSQGHKRLRNLYGHSMVASTQTGAQEHLEKERPWVLTRAAFAGSQAYATLWTGDNQANDEHMLAGIRLLLSLNLSGYGNCGMDVGGFCGEPSKELYARWVSIGAFTPFFRIHSMIDSKSREPWAFGETTEALAKNYIRLRYRLLPFFYSLFWELSKKDKPPMRPLAYHFPKADKSYDWKYQHQYHLGDQLMVVPCSSEIDGLEVWFPEHRYYDFYTDEEMEADSLRRVAAPLHRLPLYVRESSILPMESQRQSTKEKPGETLQIHLYQGQIDNSFTLYEDDGQSQNSLSRKTTFHYKAGEQKLVIESLGDFASPYKSMDLILHGFPVGTLAFRDGVQQDSRPFAHKSMEELPHFDPFFQAQEHYPTLELLGVRLEFPIKIAEICFDTQ